MVLEPLLGWEVQRNAIGSFPPVAPELQPQGPVTLGHSSPTETVSHNVHVGTCPEQVSSANRISILYH